MKNRSGETALPDLHLPVTADADGARRRQVVPLGEVLVEEDTRRPTPRPPG
jgi:hypothetical protein